MIIITPNNARPNTILFFKLSKLPPPPRCSQEKLILIKINNKKITTNTNTIYL